MMDALMDDGGSPIRRIGPDRVTTGGGDAAASRSGGLEALAAEHRVSSEDLAAAMLASTLGIDFSVDESWDEKKELFKISGKIVRTRNTTQSAVLKTADFTTVVAAAVFVF